MQGAWVYVEDFDRPSGSIWYQGDVSMPPRDVVCFKDGAAEVVSESEGIPYDVVMKNTVGLPEVIEPGQFDFEFMVDTGDTGQGPTPFRLSFDWDGGTQADWMEDIGDIAFPSPGTSSSVTGWASWLNGRDVLLAYYAIDSGFEGWARIPDVAPNDD